MGVGDDFSKFKENYKITIELISSISYRYKRITRQLNSDFWTTNSETAHSLYVGSYGSDTAAKGISDLDIAFILPNADYHKYNAYQNNGQSALLQAVKKSIQKTYSTSESFGDGQVVVITFTDGLTFEVLPVFENKDSDSFTYPNANAGGSWKVCNPRAEMAAVSKRSDATNTNMKYLARMARIWCKHCDVPMSGMLIDTLGYQFIETHEHRDKSFLYHDWMMRDFFDFLSKQDQQKTYWRAPGSGSSVARKGIFEFRARSAYLRACEAIAFDDKEWSRRQKWREVFGSLYPG
ncbi:nucleotidyltransferase [Bradyrhizobium canariense]|uniref:Nucleotidyltransferase n=1 Tax=Bradyrhizobium canariense TaxID=255045 RepID=A0ABX3WRG5_9BRAD|nr:nucleotidyltransferase [Bradyrhizobium canariense]OSJ07804.1 nucleotidyltransferase [Bradyrhizobium canariense]OSJ20651.1 nucleotidyltransferase [Bradyrhizobium canariense]